MITKLTKEQEARFPEFVEKWTAIGLSIQPINRQAAIAALAKLFGVVGRPSPKPIFCTSPLAIWLTIGNLRQIASVSDSVSDSVSASVSDSVRASVRDSVIASVSDSVRASVSDSVIASVSDSVRDSVSDSVNWNWWYDLGQFQSWWLSFYDFMAAVLAVDNSKLVGNEDFCRSAGYSVCFENLAFIGERPLVIHRAGNRLHKDGGAAVEYPDGFGVYALNGIRMKPDYVLTPAEKINPADVLKEANADQRRELIRKVGIDRMLAVLPNKRMEKRGDYELLSVDLGNGVTDARFLKMVNPSVGCFHLEGVEPGISTVEQALNWRNGQWHQHAEVLT